MTEQEIQKKVVSLYDRVKSHRRWIKENKHDPEGIKERKEWINECEEEILTLQNKRFSSQAA